MIKLTVSQLEFDKALQGAKSFATGIHAGGNLGELHFTPNGPLTLRSTDLTHEYVTQISYTGFLDEVLTITTPIAPLQAYVTKIKDGSLLLEIDKTLLHVKGTSTRTQSRFGLSDPAGVPQGFALEEDIPWVAGDTLPFTALMKHLAFAVEKPNGNRPVLQGIMAAVTNGVVEWVATDGSRLARWKGTAGDLPPALFPVKTIQEIGRWTDLTEYRWSPKIAEFRTPTTTLRVRLLAGQYPDFHRVIPEDFIATMHIDTGPLRQALERVMTVMNGREGDPLHWILDKEVVRLVITADQGQSEEEIPMQQAAGESPELLFNPRYVWEGLKGLPEDSVCQCQITGTQSPMRITNTEVPSWDYIVLPLRQLT